MVFWRIWINRVASESVFLPVHPNTSALLHEERVIASSSTSQVSLMECGPPGFEEFPEGGHSCEEN